MARTHTRSGQDARTAWWRADNGQVTAFVVALMTGLLALAGIGLDGGLALAAKIRAVGQAEAAARAGAQEVDLGVYRDTGHLVLLPARAVQAAEAQLADSDADGEVTVAGGVVVVRVTATHTTRLLRLAGVGELTVHGEARALPQGGVSGPEP